MSHYKVLHFMCDGKLNGDHDCASWIDPDYDKVRDAKREMRAQGWRCWHGFDLCPACACAAGVRVGESFDTLPWSLRDGIVGRLDCNFKVPMLDGKIRALQERYVAWMRREIELTAAASVDGAPVTFHFSYRRHGEEYAGHCWRIRQAELNRDGWGVFVAPEDHAYYPGKTVLRAWCKDRQDWRDFSLLRLMVDPIRALNEPFKL